MIISFYRILPDCNVSLFLFSRIYYEDWAFILDEERASMLPTMAAGDLVP